MMTCSRIVITHFSIGSGRGAPLDIRARRAFAAEEELRVIEPHSPLRRQRGWPARNIPAFAAMQFDLMRWREQVLAHRIATIDGVPFNRS